MECEEIRVDMRKMTPEELAEGARMMQLMFRLNHTMPQTPEYADALKQLFGDRIGEGSYVAAPIAANAQLISNNHDEYDRMILTCKPVLIREGAWIGAGATILPGVCVGKHAIVGAMSVVTKDVPDFAVVVGSPAKVVKKLDPAGFGE